MNKYINRFLYSIKQSYSICFKFWASVPIRSPSLVEQSIATVNQIKKIPTNLIQILFIKNFPDIKSQKNLLKLTTN